MNKSKLAFFLGTMLIVSSCFPVKAETSFLSDNSEIVNEQTISDIKQDDTENINQEKEEIKKESDNNQEETNIEIKEESNNNQEEINIENNQEIEIKETNIEEEGSIEENNIEKQESIETENTKSIETNNLNKEQDIVEIENQNEEKNISELTETEENISSDSLEIVDNNDGSQTITYEETISDVKEEDVENIVNDKTIEQKEIKESIENQNGTYDYNINVNEEQNIIEVIISAEQKEEAESLAIELEGEVVTEENIIVQEVSETFDSLEKAQDFITNIENNYTVIESTITVSPEQIISGVTVEQIEENGYHCIQNEDGSYDIIITGGLEQITIDLAYLSEVLEPGDSVSAEIHIKNESGDEYEIESYNKETEGPFRYIRTVSYDESMGEAIGTLMDGAYTYYIPNDIVKMHGKMHLATPSDEVVKWYNEKNNTRLSYGEIRNIITDDLLLEYYNETLNKEYDSLYEAWVDNFNNRLWQTEYNGQKGEEFFKELEWKDDEISFVMTAGVDGAGTDNMYQNTVWGYIEQIVLKVVDTIIPASYEASVTYEDVEYEYSVKYNEIEKNYTVEIKGEGNIPSVEVIIPEPEPNPEIIPEPKEEPKPEEPEIVPEIIPISEPEKKIEPEIIPISEPEKVYHSEVKSSSRSEKSKSKSSIVIIEDELVSLANESTVLGASRDFEPAVLGVSRGKLSNPNQKAINKSPQTGDSSMPWIFSILFSSILLVIIKFLKEKI